MGQVSDGPRHEVTCPNCETTIRATMADIKGLPPDPDWIFRGIESERLLKQLVEVYQRDVEGDNVANEDAKLRERDWDLATAIDQSATFLKVAQ